MTKLQEGAGILLHDDLAITPVRYRLLPEACRARASLPVGELMMPVSPALEGTGDRFVLETEDGERLPVRVEPPCTKGWAPCRRIPWEALRPR
jgi:hypothetical protein